LQKLAAEGQTEEAGL